MLIVKNLSIQLNKNDLFIVKNLSFIADKGDKIAIIGSEGSGKTTLLKSFFGLKEDYYLQDGLIQSMNSIGYLVQNIAFNQLHQKVQDFFLEELNSLDEYYHYYPVIIKKCRDFGLNYLDIEDRYLETFSGGELIKINFVRILIKEYELLLLDEPSNDLDFASQKVLIDILKALEIPIIFVSHDEFLLKQVANAIIHLELVNKKNEAQTTYLKEDYTKFLTITKAKMSAQLMVALKQQSDYQKKTAKLSSIYQAVEYQQNQVVRDPVKGQLLKKKMKALKSEKNKIEQQSANFLPIPKNEEGIDLFFDQPEKILNNKYILSIENLKLLLPN
ncbi:MAG: ATP-binding cassette domain-containing protein, partial [Acholeplasmatales bacterium]|nr:ATP-binding cassette domain-containing protein [Acholeplasmatales bacterium]